MNKTQPANRSGTLSVQARWAAELMERSLAGSVEFWAGLGRAIEPLLQDHQAMTLRCNSADQPLSACLEQVDTVAGRERVANYLTTIPYPHYEQAPDAPGYLVRIDEDGNRTVGKFVNREFQPRKINQKS